MEVRTEEKKQISCKVTGQVQGVMYRAFVEREATKKGISGTVKNIDDGSVEVFAQGKEGDLSELIEKLKIGSSAARVAKVDVVWEDLNEPMDKFKIIS